MNSGGPRLVLLVNDDPAQLTLLSGLLKRDGCDVTTCESAEKAVELITQLTPQHLVVTDLNMPGLSGLELLKEVRSAGHKCPLIIISASEVDDELVSEVETKDALLLAPYKVTGVRDIVRSLLAGQHLSTHFRMLGTETPQDAQEGIDQVALKKLMQVGGNALLTRVVGMFLDKTPSNLTLLDGYVSGADHYNVERTAHTIKGSAGMLGARRIQEAAKHLEHAGSASEVEQYPSLLQNLKSEFDEARGFFEKLVAGDITL